MSFKASNIIPVSAYTDAKDTALSLKTFADNSIVQLSSDTVSGEILAMASRLNRFKTRLNDVKGTSGIVAYAQAQEEDPAYDVAAEFLALINAVDDAINWILTNFPVDAQGYLLERKFSGTSITERIFTPAQTTGLVSALQSVSAQVG